MCRLCFSISLRRNGSAHDWLFEIIIPAKAILMALYNFGQICAQIHRTKPRQKTPKACNLCNLRSCTDLARIMNSTVNLRRKAWVLGVSNYGEKFKLTYRALTTPPQRRLGPIASFGIFLRFCLKLMGVMGSSLRWSSGRFDSKSSMDAIWISHCNRQPPSLQ
jgi:hypothetical protein